ncbi:serine/threonine-protein kinase [Vitiosangium sp. GDMCC 1.1324]|uniref:serine/threonine-protein kinase n=1 Tax=Vitiosangium sp. (strain GDMCC 1.1324) TaxID=2138576 RepID=UPI000D351F9C|nr:serine/threonine-protein kinase [Vitiosangium sp. GDMCC 1.1324]PTL80253.1 serine/threonine protein kinase [Vitiosangium sp. GDMCC 1.1324]
MHPDFEVELRAALAEGLLSEQEADSLREEARRLERSPLALLRERGRLSEGTLISMMAQVRGATPPQVAAPPPPPAPEVPVFPVSGWERYQCVRFLGEGGMGRVFLAHDPRLNRNVALKFVRGDEPELTRRFLSEARAQARVTHERVCKVYEVGEVQGRVYIAMQFIEGRTLSALARELSVEQKVLVLREAAEGVHEAHRVGLIHRDLKPSNIMVERAEDGSLRPYVMDFGLARDWNDRATVTGAVMGTPQYMSPEQARGEVSSLDRRADVYSLGATLYSVLTGQPPIPGGNGLEVLNNVLELEPRPPRAVDPNIPADLEAIALKCLEKERSARYDSARALVEELDRFLSGEPVQARSNRAWYRLRKKLHKYRLVVSVAAVLVLLALGQAGLARREAAVRERLARRFTESVERIEALARYSDLSRLHDTRADQRVIRARMAALEAEIQEAGEQAVGPGHYALGRGYLALGDEARARESLESAWKHGFREPRVAYALALVTGHQYQEQLLEAERIRDTERREARKREIERGYREPALAYLRQSEGAEVPSAAYVAALLAFYENRWDEALSQLDAIGTELSWFHEAPKLRGDILLARAMRHWNQGEHEGARADFEAGRKAYAEAAAIGESVASIYTAQGELEYGALILEQYGKGEVTPHYTQALQAVSRALEAMPEHYDARVLESRLHRRLAEHQRDLGDYSETLPEKAVAAARSALELESSRSKARLELGLSYWIWGYTRQSHSLDPREQLRKAVESFESIAPAERDYDFLLNLGLVYKTWADYDEQVGADPLPRYGKAIESFHSAIELDGQVPEGWINLGIAHYTRASHPRAPEPDGDLTQALAALDKARILNPGHVVPYFYAGLAHELVARRLRVSGGEPGPSLERSAEMYRKGLELGPGIPQLHNGLCLTLVQQAQASWDRGGDPFPVLDQARAACEQSVAIAPKSGYGQINLSEVLAHRALYQRARGEDPGPSVHAADEALRQALQWLPENAGALANRGMVHAILATFELEHGRDPRPSSSRAEKALRQALAHNPAHAEAWYYLGEALGARALYTGGRPQDSDEADHAYQKGLALAPERQEFRVGFGHFLRRWSTRLMQEKQDPGPLLQRGLEMARELLAVRPGWPDARLLRGSLLALQAALPSADPGQKQEWRRQAREDLSSALAANAGFQREWGSSLQRLQSGVP